MRRIVHFYLLCLIFIPFLATKAATNDVNCAAPTQLTLVNLNANSLTFTWTDSNATVVQWEVFYTIFNTGLPTASTTGTPVFSIQHTLTNLTPGTYYSIFVRSHCPNGEVSSWSNPLNVMNPASPPSCGSTFTDSGGVNYGYSANEDLTWTVCPSMPGEYTSVVFSEFNVSAQINALYIYDGPDTNSPLIASGNGPGNVPGGLAGGYWGNQLPGPFLATNQSGCLTFRFRSATNSQNSGWNARVDCIPDPNCYDLNTAVTATQITDTSVTVTWTPPSGITQWEVLYVPCTSAPPSADTNGIQVNTNSYTFTNLNPNTCYTPYVRSLCPFPPGGYSLWSIGSTFTSHYPDLSCDAVFTDYPGVNSNGYANNANHITTICPDATSESVTVTFTSFSTEVNFDTLYVYNGNSTQAPMITSNNGPGFFNSSMPGGYWGTTIPGPFTSTSPDGCLTFQFISDSSVVSSGWEANVTCNNIQPKLIAIAFVDLNGNGIQEYQEPYFKHGNFAIQMNNSGTTTLVNTATGCYTLYDSDPTNTYDISYSIYPDAQPFYQGNGYSVNDTTISATTQYVYFPITYIQPFSDVEVTLTPVKSAVIGTQHYQFVRLRNNGPLPTSGTLTYTKPSQITSISSPTPGVTTSTNGFTYPYQINAFSTVYIDVKLTIPSSPTVSINESISATASATASNDINSSNNTFSLTEQIVGSWDPNTKSEVHGPLIPITSFNTDDYFYYQINFQNEGTANAEKVQIEDDLENGIIPESVQMVASSHNYILERTGNHLVWKMDNIQLPPKSVSNVLSRGHVQFKAKLQPGFQSGTQITNSASIFFDSNPAVITNTWVSEFVAPMSTQTFNNSLFVLYPNPAQTTIYIQNTTDEVLEKISIWDVTGKCVQTRSSFDQTQPSFGINDLSNGWYIIELIAKNGTRFYTKFIKN